MEKINAFIQNTKGELDVIFDFHAPSILINTPIYYNGFKDLLNRGCRIRCITEVTPDNLHFCKEILNLVTDFRHIEGMKGGIAVNRSEYISTFVIETDQPVTELYYTNLKPIVGQGQYIFDTFWKNSVAGISKINEIEQGKVPEVIRSIHDPVLLQNQVVELLRSANKEILVIFSSANAFERQKNAGSIEILKEVGHAKPHVKIRMLTPHSQNNQTTLDELSRNNPNFDYIFIEPIIRVTILVVDRKFSIVVELKDDTKRTIAEAIGQATYSNSAPTVLTYTVLFDALWNQTALYEQLQLHDRMQKEFIDAVAHELRTPLTPIIGLTKHVIDTLNDDEQRQLLDVVLYNGMKLQALSENVLAVTKLEGNQLRLSKEVFDLSLVIIDVIKGFELGLDKIRYVSTQYNKKIHFQLDGIDKKYMVYADRYRITQVITNLIDNAVNFILDKEGLISISLEKSIENDTNFVLVQIKDNGEGIHHEIIPRLFTKFATKSFYGTGLGLYICKEIIEMHQGKIWGSNNDDGQGATFSFRLRLID